MNWEDDLVTTTLQTIPARRGKAVRLNKGQSVKVINTHGNQVVDFVVDEDTFRNEIMAARTFGFAHEVEALRQAGLARGGSLENAVVIDGDQILNPGGLRMEREFVKHKALDAIGDLYVLGAPLLGRYEGFKAGHAINNLLVRELLANPQAWREVVRVPEMAMAG